MTRKKFHQYGGPFAKEIIFQAEKKGFDVICCNMLYDRFAYMLSVFASLLATIGQIYSVERQHLLDLENERIPIFGKIEDALLEECVMRSHCSQ